MVFCWTLIAQARRHFSVALRRRLGRSAARSSSTRGRDRRRRGRRRRRPRDDGRPPHARPPARTRPRLDAGGARHRLRRRRPARPRQERPARRRPGGDWSYDDSRRARRADARRLRALAFPVAAAGLRRPQPLRPRRARPPVAPSATPTIDALVLARRQRRQSELAVAAQRRGLRRRVGIELMGLLSRRLGRSRRAACATAPTTKRAGYVARLSAQRPRPSLARARRLRLLGRAVRIDRPGARARRRRRMLHVAARRRRAPSSRKIPRTRLFTSSAAPRGLPSIPTDMGARARRARAPAPWDARRPTSYAPFAAARSDAMMRRLARRALSPTDAQRARRS